ncbi:hypothetical protein Csa_019916 [Cucumis sativus]|uniref:DUF7745 domain-containing protein n=1 Tax=Cucumis sativus TaxID=3659 RepID=A0A0A0LTS2_CUCSA|nr:hypothetical protein Csa_019916 [Cucumis sativus]
MIGTHSPNLVAQNFPSEDSWEGMTQWLEKLQQETDTIWPKSIELSLPQTCRLEIVNNSMEGLKSLWESLTKEHRIEFVKAYRNITDLKYTSINAHALQALVQFWDPVLKCFTFNTFD